MKVKEPDKKRPAAIFWLTKGSNLTPDNPKQGRLPLMDVKASSEPARDVSGDSTPAKEA